MIWKVSLLAAGGLLVGRSAVGLARALAEPLEGGEGITAADEPRLVQALRATRMPFDDVRLRLDARVEARVEGPGWRALLGRGRRVLYLGLAAVEALEVCELQAAAFIALREPQSPRHEIAARLSKTDPLRWLLGARRSRASSSADEHAARIFGGDAVEGALRKLAFASDWFARNAWGCATALRRAGLPCTDLLRDLAAAEAVTPRLLRDDRLARRLARGTEPVRIEHIQRVPGTADRDRSAASGLLRDLRHTSRILTGSYVANVDAHLRRLGATASALAAPADAEVAFAEGIALHDASADLSQRKLEEANEVAVAALARLEGALGREHPMLVAALANAARAEARLGRPDVARPLLDRALAIQRRDAAADENETLRLQTLLDRL